MRFLSSRKKRQEQQQTQDLDYAWDVLDLRNLQEMKSQGFHLTPMDSKKLRDLEEQFKLQTLVNAFSGGRRLPPECLLWNSQPNYSSGVVLPAVVANCAAPPIWNPLYQQRQNTCAPPLLGSNRQDCVPPSLQYKFRQHHQQ